MRAASNRGASVGEFPRVRRNGGYGIALWDGSHATIDGCTLDANEHGAILPTEWTAGSEELTPTLELKRRVINKKYGDPIEALYAS